jgi:hypothetical protein
MVEHERRGILSAGYGDVQGSPVVECEPEPFHVHDWRV